MQVERLLCCRRERRVDHSMVAEVLQIRADVSVNRIYTLFQGKVENASLQKELPEFTRLLSTLRPGFSLVTDLTSVESMALGCEQTIRVIMDLCRAQGVGTVVRIVPDPRKDIGFNILGRFHYGPHVTIITCETREQAEQAMNT